MWVRQLPSAAPSTVGKVMLRRRITAATLLIFASGVVVFTTTSQVEAGKKFNVTHVAGSSWSKRVVDAR